MVPRKGGAAANTIFFPADLVEEILHRLPSNDLLHFQLVSKEWLRLILSPEFIKKHLERSKANSHHPHIVKFSPSEVQILGYSANNPTTKKIDNVRLLGSCDGLILYYKPVVGEIQALNPSTGMVAVDARLTTNPCTEKNDDDHLMCTWFGHHPTTQEYVLVFASSRYSKFGETSAYIMFKVYRLSSNNLLSSLTEEVEWGTFFSCPDIGTFLHGRLHVISFSFQDSKPDEILAYDLRTNVIVRMLAPLLQPCHALGVVNGYLCALHKNEVWMMKEYGVKGSWTKYANIDDKIPKPIQSCPNGDVFSDELLKPFRDGAKARLRDGYGIFLTGKVVVCIDSLVSPTVVFGTTE